jgi:hypothetical protein
MGQKPWWPRPQAYGKWDKFCAFYGRSSPYTAVAERHAGALVSSTWLQPTENVDRVVHFLGFGNPALFGLPIALFADMVRSSKLAKKHIAGLSRTLKGDGRIRSQKINDNVR